MEENISKLNLVSKLAKIREIVNVTEKTNEGYGYMYVDLPTILAQVDTGMKKYGVSLIPRMVQGTQNVVQNVTHNTKVSRTGEVYDNASTEMMFTAQMVYTWINNDNIEDTIEVPWYLVGAQSDPSQAEGTALSYALRQFLIQYFQIAMVGEGDVDAYRKKQKEAEDTEKNAVLNSLKDQIGVTIDDLKANGVDRDYILGVCNKYVNGGNYLKINSAEAVGKLYKELVNILKEKKEGNKNEKGKK